MPTNHEKIIAETPTISVLSSAPHHHTSAAAFAMTTQEKIIPTMWNTMYPMHQVKLISIMFIIIFDLLFNFDGAKIWFIFDICK